MVRRDAAAGGGQTPLFRRRAIAYSGGMSTASLPRSPGSVLTGLILALALAIASVLSMAERLRAEGAMQVVLCGTPGVEQVITLDAQGRPLTPVHHLPGMPCPDRGHRPCRAGGAAQAGNPGGAACPRHRAAFGKPGPALARGPGAAPDCLKTARRARDPAPRSFDSRTNHSKD